MITYQQALENLKKFEEELVRTSPTAEELRNAFAGENVSRETFIGEQETKDQFVKGE